MIKWLPTWSFVKSLTWFMPARTMWSQPLSRFIWRHGGQNSGFLNTTICNNYHGCCIITAKSFHALSTKKTHRVAKKFAENLRFVGDHFDTSIVKDVVDCNIKDLGNEDIIHNQGHLKWWFINGIPLQNALNSGLGIILICPDNMGITCEYKGTYAPTNAISLKKLGRIKGFNFTTKDPLRTWFSLLGKLLFEQKNDFQNNCLILCWKTFRVSLQVCETTSFNFNSVLSDPVVPCEHLIRL